MSNKNTRARGEIFGFFCFVNFIFMNIISHLVATFLMRESSKVRKVRISGICFVLPLRSLRDNKFSFHPSIGFEGSTTQDDRG